MHPRTDVGGAWVAGGIEVPHNQGIAPQMPHGHIIHIPTIRALIAIILYVSRLLQLGSEPPVWCNGPSWTQSQAVGGSNPRTAIIFALLLLFFSFALPFHALQAQAVAPQAQAAGHTGRGMRHLASLAELGMFRTLWFII